MRESLEEHRARIAEWERDNLPLRWQGHHVYIRAIDAIGFVSGSNQNGSHPERNTITVELVNRDGTWRGKDVPMITYTMSEAREGLVPDVRCIITERMGLFDDRV